MAVQSPSLRTIFEHALEIPAGLQRDAYLDNACASDTELRAEVESLLTAHANAGSFLDHPAAGLDRSAPRSGEGLADCTLLQTPIAERPGTVIGPYKLLQQIGEGGMGVVFMAEQSEPIQRTVALKIIKPGMDTRQVIARFEAERQALAMMDHPNIAKVLDAGTTDSGRLYFVMELVKGVPITKYCDDKKLSVRDRLELFLPVCHAVQHAHQKGIIHRDIKPTNVLVAEYDNHAVPKSSTSASPRRPLKSSPSARCSPSSAR
jgi:serine/threonine protein kinase